MENIIMIKGKVKYEITLDPGVWIFDDRRIDLKTYNFHTSQLLDENEEYAKAISKHWDREITEGSIYPPTMKSEKKFEKEKILTGTFAVPLKPFLTNASPDSDAAFLIIRGEGYEEKVSLEKAYDLLLKFSDNGKPLSDSGPVHVFYGDGSNLEQPMGKVKEFVII